MENNELLNIISLDQQLLLYINSLNSPFWDEVMYVISGSLVWVPLYLAILTFTAIRYRKKFFVILPFIILAIALADLSSVHLFKNIVQRLRPCHEPALEGLVHIVRGKCGGAYSFVSSHAANCFCAATVSSLFLGKRWFSTAMVCWAAIIGYSRIYLGVHYPGDVICGAALGFIVGWGVFRLYEIADVRVFSHSAYFTTSMKT
ncbi:MAG: phosphatase PAP2 family protein [Bacteroidales bacterium]|jgi:undecaprenyl-diphosphatase|nr:phosphatase PAP2 family protein [Bacteroidales bacterium]